MNRFEASDGTVIDPAAGPGGELRVLPAATFSTLDLRESTAQALREFFQAEADERLGRWRWPENPEWVLYPNEDGDVVALDESAGQSTSLLSRLTVGRFPNAQGCPAARAYFDAHPEPKPWTRAAAGELWFLTITSLGPETRLRWEAQGDPVRFWSGGLHIDAHSDEITAGRRVNTEASA